MDGGVVSDYEVEESLHAWLMDGLMNGSGGNCAIASKASANENKLANTENGCYSKRKFQSS